MRPSQSGPARAALGGLIVLASLGPASLIRAAQAHPAVPARSVPTDVPVPDVTLAVARLAARDRLWRDTLLWNNTVRWNRAVASAREAAGRAATASRRASELSHSTRIERPAVLSTGVCGRDLPSCCIVGRESGGNPRAKNPSSSASGLYQFLDSTWGGYGGYGRAMDAPASVQVERARQVWAGGAGAGNWAGPGC